MSDHDLRHHLALLVLDLHLSRERLRQRPATLLHEVAALLGRLDDGLLRAEAMLAGNALPVAETDRAEIVADIWDRFRRAGRLPAGAVLKLRRPFALTGDPSALHSVVLNLLENACSAAPAGPLRVEADDCGLLVENGGAPLPAAIVERLNRGEAPPRAPGGRGRGLGLILAGARSLGLVLKVEADDGLTRFSLRCSHTGAAAPGAPALLVVEDDADLRAMLVELMRQEGFRVESSSGAETPPPRAGAYAAILADLNLPGLKGDALLSAWKAADAALLTLLLTGDRGAATMSREGVDAVVVKPGLERLLALLAPLLGEKR